MTVVTGRKRKARIQLGKGRGAPFDRRQERRGVVIFDLVSFLLLPLDILLITTTTPINRETRDAVPCPAVACIITGNATKEETQAAAAAAGGRKRKRDTSKEFECLFHPSWC